MRDGPEKQTRVAAMDSPGFAELGNGLILQWGMAELPADGGDVRIVFPLSFPRALFSVTGAGEGGDAILLASDVHGFTVSNREMQPVFYNWMAVGS